MTSVSCSLMCQTSGPSGCKKCLRSHSGCQKEVHQGMSRNAHKIKLLRHSSNWTAAVPKWTAKAPVCSWMLPRHRAWTASNEFTIGSTPKCVGYCTEDIHQLWGSAPQWIGTSNVVENELPVIPFALPIFI